MTRDMKKNLNAFVLGLVLALLTSCGESKQGTQGGVLGLQPINEDQTQRIHLYRIGTVLSSFGGRSGADTHCENNLPADLVGKETHALISVNATDEILDMVANYNVPLDREIIGHNSGTVIATSWADFLDGSLAVSLEQAGVMPAGDTFWSGSNANGSLTVANCSEWTSSASNVFGAAGSATATTSWTYTVSAACNSLRSLLCIAY